MASLFEGLFGRSVDLKAIYENGAIILDVREPEEFSSGHIDGAFNIPVGQVQGAVAELKKKGNAVITCCRSGVRSGMAKSILKRAGLEAYNGGPWNSLQRQIL